MDEPVIFESDAKLLTYCKSVLVRHESLKTKDSSPPAIETLFETYQRLRQIPRLVACLSQAITSLQEDDYFELSFQWPAETLKRFAVCCQEFPPGQMFEIWTTLLAGVDTNLIPVANGKLSSISKKSYGSLVKIWIDLFATFLMHCRLLHYSSMLLSSATKADELMEATACRAVPLFKAFLRGVIPNGSSVLIFCYAWGELSLLMQQYWNSFATVRGTLKKSVFDFSYVYPNIAREDWKEYASLSRTKADVVLYNLNVLLLLQKFRGIMQLKGNFETRSKCLNATAQAVGRQILGLNEKNYEQESISSIWQSVLSQLPVLLPYWTPDVCLQVANIMVKLACNTGNKQLQEAAVLAIGDVTCTEGKYFQAALTSTILKNLLSTLCDVGVEGADGLKQLLCDYDLVSEINSLPLEENCKVSWLPMKEAGMILNRLLGNSSAVALLISSSAMECILQYFKVFKLLPLSYLLPINQAKCLFGVFCALNAVQLVNSEDRTLNVDVIVSGRQIIDSILHGFRSVWLFDLIDAGIVLCWTLDSQASYIAQNENGNTDLLHETFKETLSGLLRLSINNRGTFLATSTVIDKLEGQRKSFAELSHHGKYVYIIAVNCTMNLLMMVMKRSFKYTSIKDTCERHLLVISRTIISIVKQLEKENVWKESFKSHHVRAALLRSFANVIEVSEELVGKQQPIKWKRHLQFMFQEAFQILEKQQTEELLLQSSFEFMNAILQHCQECEHVFPHNFMHNLWLVVETTHSKYYWGFSEHNDTFTASSIFTHKTSKPADFGNSIVPAIENIFISLLLRCSVDEVDKIIQDLTYRLQIYHQPSSLLAQLRSTFRLLHILPYDQLVVLGSEKSAVISLHLSHIICFLHSLLCSYCQEGNNMEHVLIPVLQLLGQTIVPQTKIVTRNSNILNICFHICVEALNQSYLSPFAVFEKIVITTCEIFNALLFHHKFDVITMMPALSCGLMNLLQAVVRRSDQSKLFSEEAIEHVVCAAQHVNRFLMCLCQGRRKDFSRIAPYIVAEFVSEIQQITVIPIVKETLSTGMFNILSMCDAYSVALLQVNLPHSNKELFNEFLQMHKKRRKARTKI